jgi:hypothetical protein
MMAEARKVSTDEITSPSARFDHGGLTQTSPIYGAWTQKNHEITSDSKVWT